ncbi:MAG: tRNA pseudouridine(38-40) synthase TruA, partial [Anaerolineae bacterium]|nr:tRNA pseudouridine(38-40) synthase TruA [Anaerolineae bacterium]
SDLYQFVIEGNAFLKHMVRRIVGTLVEVGRGKMSLKEFADAFAAADRRRAGPTAPPHGLTLVHVKFLETER